MMSVYYRVFLDRYYEWRDTRADRLVGEYPLMYEPWNALAIVFGYLLMVRWGPKLMRNRKPLTLETYSYFYNIGQLVFCLYMVISIYLLTEIEPNGIYLWCKKFDHFVINPETLQARWLVYLNFVARVVELSETAVHILRKKDRQISVLHVTHHTMNVMLGWLCARTATAGTGLTFIMANFAIHFIMFSYYLAVSSKNSTLLCIAKKFKRYLTTMQMIQFVYMFCIVSTEFIHDSCGSVPIETGLFGLFVVIVNLLLFAHFYWKTYVLKSPSKSD